MIPHPSLLQSTVESPDLSIVAPCFNEEDGLREFHRRGAILRFPKPEDHVQPPVLVV